MSVSVVSLADPHLEIARGNIKGQSGVNKFGMNPAIAKNTTEDVWSGGGTYSFPGTADITHISQAADQETMRGETIEVEGLDTNWNLTVQTVDLNGADTSTAVVLTTALRRVFRMTVQANVVTDQDVNLKNVGAGTTYGVITAGDNQTAMAIYTVPNGVTAYMTRYWGDLSEDIAANPRSVLFDLQTADRDNSYAFRVQMHKAVSLEGNAFEFPFRPYLQITQKTDIKVAAHVTNDFSAHVHAGFDLILVDN